MEEKAKLIWVTGALGNLGVSLCKKLLADGHRVIGIDNKSRGELLGKEGDVSDNIYYIKGDFLHEHVDVRSADWHMHIAHTTGGHPDVIIHAAAQVSHPKSIEIPALDFAINAMGTLQLLEYVRRVSPKTQFIHIGTAKIYGQNVDKLWPYEEMQSRFWYGSGGVYKGYFQGVNEHCSFDQTLKTPFGCSKACADLYVQEYGRLYGLSTSVLRPGVFTGQYAKPTIYQNWVGDIMQKMLKRPQEMELIGWKGKQVRDVLHCDDLVNAIILMINDPPPKGEVYNIGGGMNNTISVLEAFAKIGKMITWYPEIKFAPTREGDWCVYVTDNSKLMKQYPEWKVQRNLDYIFQELYETLAPKILEEKNEL